jgi:hypothetical protein
MSATGIDNVQGHLVNVAAEITPREQDMIENRSHSIPHRHIPDILKVPEGNELLLRAKGIGAQIYKCPVSTNSKATPHAILLTSDEDERDLVAIHFEGPTWQSFDGSSVVGDAQNAKHFTSPDQDGVDWLLLPAQSTTGNGLFSRVTYIQRLFTDGGKPPAQACDQANGQTQVPVQYSAEYRFYTAKQY